MFIYMPGFLLFMYVFVAVSALNPLFVLMMIGESAFLTLGAFSSQL